MGRTIRTVSLALALVFSLTFVPSAAADTERIALGSAADCWTSVAWGVNAQGDAVGACATWDSGEWFHAALWKDGTFTDLGTLGGTRSIATAINNRGQVVGYSTTETGEDHAFIWENGTLTDLGTLGGTRSAATGINDRGQVVGSSTTETGEYHAFLWENGTFTELATLPGTYSSAATGINNRGQVVGANSLLGDGSPDLLWERDSMTVLEMPDSWWYTSVSAINESGDVVGECGGPHWQHACLWQDGSWIDLGALEPAPGLVDAYSTATDINNRRQVVGHSSTGSGGLRPILWENGVIIVLDTTVGLAHGINDRGQVVGTAAYAGPPQAVMWITR